MNTLRWSKPITMAAVTALGLALSYLAHQESGNLTWPIVGLCITAAILLVLGISYSEIAGVERRGAERFRAVIDNAHDAIIAIDAQGRVELFNPAAERIFGYASEEVLGRNVNMLMPQPYHREHDGYIHNYLTTGKPRIIGTGREVEALHKDGTIFPIDLSVGEIRSNTGRGFIGVIRDNTQRHQAEQRVRELNAELIHVSRLTAMGQLSSSLAHELNQPLTAIMNYAEAARHVIEASGAAVPSNVQDLLVKTVGQAERAGQIIRRLRSFVEKAPAERHLEELNKIVTEASNLATIGARVDGIRVQFDLDAALAPISVDKIQIQQVVVNLVRNAIEALRDAGRRELTIGTRTRGEGQEVWVQDTGPGIPHDIMSRLFTPFVTSKKDGMGIGLSISRSIIEAHDGRLWVEAPRSGGTIFRFVIPNQKPKADPS